MPARLRHFLPVLLAACALALAAVGVSACGDDEPSAETAPTTEPTTPTETSTSERTDTAPQGAPESDAPSGPEGSQGQPGSSGGAAGPGGGVDSPENDIPPPPGSPAERFEQECQVNPDACR